MGPRKYTKRNVEGYKCHFGEVPSDVNSEGTMLVLELQ